MYSIRTYAGASGRQLGCKVVTWVREQWCLEVPSRSVRHNMGELCLMSLLGLGQAFVAFLVTRASGWCGNPEEGLFGWFL